MDTIAIEEMFEGLGPVSIRRMFGGKGIYHQGLIVAIELRDELMLKADAMSAPEFASAGAAVELRRQEGQVRDDALLDGTGRCVRGPRPHVKVDKTGLRGRNPE